MTALDQANNQQENSEQAFRGIVTACAQAIDVALAEFLETDRDAGPHKARVALRRLTTALDAFAPILRRKPAKRLRRDAKKLFRSLGQVRDSDVFLQNHAHEPGHDQRLKRNLGIRLKVRREMRRQRAVAFTGELLKSALADGELYKRSSSAAELRNADVTGIARAALNEAWQKCRAYGPSIQRLDATTLHEFRKDMKALRYLSEFFTDVFPDIGEGPFDDSLRDMQDCLGVLNDYAVAMQILGRKPSPDLPAREKKAMERAEDLWKTLSAQNPPWQKTG